MNNRLLENISTFFGIGLVEKYPGTVASFISGMLWYFYISIFNPHIIISILIIIFFFIIGYYSIEKYPIEDDNTDPQEIVIDEVVGMFISLLGLNLFFSLSHFFVAFLFFRIFDSFKPSLIYRFEIDKKKSSILMDDCIAGLFTLLLMLSLGSSGIL